MIFVIVELFNEILLFLSSRSTPPRFVYGRELYKHITRHIYIGRLQCLSLHAQHDKYYRLQCRRARAT